MGWAYRSRFSAPLLTLPISGGSTLSGLGAGPEEPEPCPLLLTLFVVHAKITSATVLDFVDNAPLNIIRGAKQDHDDAGQPV